MQVTRLPSSRPAPPPLARPACPLPSSACASGSCTGDAAAVTEGRKSFPSGHSTLVWAGLGLVSIAYAARLADLSTPRLGSLFKVVVEGVAVDPPVPMSQGSESELPRVCVECRVLSALGSVSEGQHHVFAMLTFFGSIQTTD